MGETKRLGALALLLAVVWAVFAVAVTHSALPPTSLNFGLERGWAYPLAPEWWAFFTRDPTEAQPFAFRRTGEGEWVSALAFPNGSALNLLGWRRKGRAQAPDLEQILEQVPQDAWYSCSASSPVDCLDHASRTLKVALNVDQPLLCGRFALARLRPVPWEQVEWEDVETTTDVVRVDVRCRRG